MPYAFTGANPKGKKGLVELANNGTLFLDEIGELLPNIQVKLLDFLENQRFTSVGGLESKTVNTRIITATNKNLKKRVAENKTFSTEVIESLIQYDWPGNVRQLKNAVEQMAVMSLGSVIGIDRLPEQLVAFFNNENMKKHKVIFDDLVENYKQTIIENYYETYGNANEIAEALGLSQTTAYRLINKYIKK